VRRGFRPASRVVVISGIAGRHRCLVGGASGLRHDDLDLPRARMISTSPTRR
jgi:hypothetical protein